MQVASIYMYLSGCINKTSSNGVIFSALAYRIFDCQFKFNVKNPYDLLATVYINGNFFIILRLNWKIFVTHPVYKSLLRCEKGNTLTPWGKHNRAALILSWARHNRNTQCVCRGLSRRVDFNMRHYDNII